MNDLLLCTYHGEKTNKTNNKNNFHARICMFTVQGEGGTGGEG